MRAFSPALPFRHALLIGDEEPMVLTGDYAEEQLWLGFMKGAIIPRPEEEHKPWSPPRRKVEETEFASVPHECIDIYANVAVGEPILPFHEFRQIVNKRNGKKMRAADWPGWDRRASGSRCTVTVDGSRRNEIVHWCLDNCRGQFAVNGASAHFQSRDDATLASLFFGVSK